MADDFPSSKLAEMLSRLAGAQRLSADEADWLFEELLNGRLSELQVAAVLAMMQVRGPAVDELVGAARVMRRHVTPVAFDPGHEQAVLIDTCGTGGAPKTFNISTAAAIVAAACELPTGHRVHVAKHGNRSRTGRGSAEVLAALGVHVDAAPQVQARCLREAGVCFCFAIHHHPAMRHAAGPRRGLGFPTIFNLLGPLTNPAGADRQLIGVYDVQLVAPVAHALARLGARRALVVHGLDGLDEISTTAPTRMAAVQNGAVSITEFDPRSLDLPRVTLAELSVASVEDAAAQLRRVLAGKPGPHRDIVAVNTAAALLVAGVVPTWTQGLQAAFAALDSGRAARTLEHLAEISRSA